MKYKDRPLVTQSEAQTDARGQTDKTITDEEFQQVLKEVSDDMKKDASEKQKKIAFYNYLYLLLGYSTGARRMTILRFRFGDFTISKKGNECTVSALEQKTNKTFTLTVPGEIYNLVEQSKQYHSRICEGKMAEKQISEQYVFDIQSSPALQARLDGLKKKYPKLENFVARDLRRLFIRNMSQKLGLNAAMKAVQHTKVGTT